MMPGRDDNYPSSSGNMGAALGNLSGFSIGSFHITIGLMVAIIIGLVIWAMVRK